MIGKNEASWIEKYKAENKQVRGTTKKASKEAHKLRQDINDSYEKFNIEETNGYKSRLEALWVVEFESCDSFRCVECVQVPVWIDGPYGKFLSNYKPDIVLDFEDGSFVLVELKPNHNLAMADDRQKRALELNPNYRFVVIGGYPYSKKGVTVRMLTGNQEQVHKYIKVPEVLRFLGCA